MQYYGLRCAKPAAAIGVDQFKLNWICCIRCIYCIRVRNTNTVNTVNTPDTLYTRATPINRGGSVLIRSKYLFLSDWFAIYQDFIP